VDRWARVPMAVPSRGGELNVEIPFVDRQVPNVLGGFLPIFVMMVAGEFGDKTS